MDIREVKEVMLTEEKVLWDKKVCVVSALCMKVSGYNPQVKTRPFYYTLILQHLANKNHTYEVMIEDVERLGG